MSNSPDQPGFTRFGSQPGGWCQCRSRTWIDKGRCSVHFDAMMVAAASDSIMGAFLVYADSRVSSVFPQVSRNISASSFTQCRLMTTADRSGPESGPFSLFHEKRSAIVSLLWALAKAGWRWFHCVPKPVMENRNRRDQAPHSILPEVPV